MIVGKDRLDPVGDALGQRHLHEDQRLVADRRVEKPETAAVAVVQSATQIVPTLDLVHRFVANDLFQDGSRRGPVDSLQHQEAPVEPGGEQVDKIGVDRVEILVPLHQRQEILAHLDQLVGRPLRQVQPAQHLLAKRLTHLEQRRQMLVGAITLVDPVGGIDLVGIGREVLGECIEEGFFVLLSQRLVDIQRPAGQHDTGGLAIAVEQLLAGGLQVSVGVTDLPGAKLPLQGITLGNAAEQLLQKTHIHSANLCVGLRNQYP